jgi:hypothetical protein
LVVEDDMTKEYLNSVRGLVGIIAILPLIGGLITTFIFNESAPVFVYILFVIWLAIFITLFLKPRSGYPGFLFVPPLARVPRSKVKWHISRNR